MWSCYQEDFFLLVAFVSFARCIRSEARAFDSLHLSERESTFSRSLMSCNLACTRTGGRICVHSLDISRTHMRVHGTLARDLEEFAEYRTHSLEAGIYIYIHTHIHWAAMYIERLSYQDPDDSSAKLPFMDSPFPSLLFDHPRVSPNGERNRMLNYPYFLLIWVLQDLFIISINSSCVHRYVCSIFFSDV